MNTLATLAAASILCASSAAFADGGKHRVHTPPTPTRENNISRRKSVCAITNK